MESSVLRVLGEIQYSNHYFTTKDLSHIARTSKDSYGKHADELISRREQHEHSRIEACRQAIHYLPPVAFVNLTRTSKYLYKEYQHQISGKKDEYIDERTKREGKLFLGTTHSNRPKTTLFGRLAGIFGIAPGDRNKPSTAGSFTREVKDESRVGDVYLATYGKRSPHYSLIIDTAGESTDEVIIGCEAHISVNLKTRETGLAWGERVTKRTSFSRIDKIGKIDNEDHYNDPSRWGSALITAASRTMLCI